MWSIAGSGHVRILIFAKTEQAKSFFRNIGRRPTNATAIVHGRLTPKKERSHLSRRECRPRVYSTPDAAKETLPYGVQSIEGEQGVQSAGDPPADRPQAPDPGTFRGKGPPRCGDRNTETGTLFRNGSPSMPARSPSPPFNGRQMTFDTGMPENFAGWSWFSCGRS
jgi:hypothetical protein